MIFPLPSNPLKFEEAPMTWALLLVNILVFFMLMDPSGVEGSSEQKIFHRESLVTTGRLFYQDLMEAPPKELFSHPDWVHRMRLDDREALEVLGLYALRQEKFLESALHKEWNGDPVDLKQWRQNFKEFMQSQKNPIYLSFALGGARGSWLSWISYQFTHTSALHLLSNMLFLAFLGFAVESALGGGRLLVIYLFGGVSGGLFFNTLGLHGSAPMIGASASISALLVFWSLWRGWGGLRYFYFISPFPGHYGFVYFPAVFLLLFFFIPDLAHMLSTPQGLGVGVAHSAHVGGALFGALQAILLRGFYKKSYFLTKS